MPRRGSAAPPAAPAPRWRWPPAAGWRGRAAAPWPSPVVPSGNTATMSPACSASAIWCTTRSASRLRSRSMNSVPPPATSQPSSGQCLHVGLGDEARRVHRVDGQDVEPGDVVGHQQHRRRRARVPCACEPDAQRAQHARRPAADMRACAAPASASGNSSSADRARRASAVQHGAHQPPQRAQRHAPLAPASVARGFEGHVPADQRARARGPAARSRRRACACPGCAARAGAPSSAPPGRTRTGRPRRPRPAGRRSSPASPARRRAPRTGSLVTRGQRLRQRQAAALRPTSAPGRAAVRARWRRARPRRRAAFLASSSTGVWSLTSASIVPSASAGAERIAVALLAQRRRQAHRGVEVADVDVGQVQVS